MDVIFFRINAGERGKERKRKKGFKHFDIKTTHYVLLVFFFLFSATEPTGEEKWIKFLNEKQPCFYFRNGTTTQRQL